MDAVFFVAWLVVGLGLLIASALYVAARRDDERWLNWFLLPLVVFGVLAAYLVTKLIYEEFIPCAMVDERYCDFDSTQERNLFGWDF